MSLLNRLALACLAAGLVFTLASARAEDASAAAAASAPASLARPASLDIAYVDADLRAPGLAAPSGPDADLVDWHVPDLGRLLRERAPLVLAANGLAGSGIVVPAPAPGTPPDLSAIAAGRPVLLLSVATFRKSTPRLFTKAGTLVFDVRLVDGAPDAAAANRRLQVTGGQLGFDPVLGVLKTSRVDAAWVDRVLASALDGLGQAGLVQLPGPKALVPKD